MVLLLQELPAELLHHTLLYLPLTDLLSFARTSRSNYHLAKQALTSLDIAIFPRKVHSLLAFFGAANEDHFDIDDGDNFEDRPISRYRTLYSNVDASLNQIGLTTPRATRPALFRSTTPPNPDTLSKSRTLQPRPQPTPLSLRTAEINNQNALATSILSTPSLSNLRILTLRLYDFSSPHLASTIATAFPHLHTLTLDHHHPYVHDTTLPSRFWTSTPTTGSPIWNVLAGIGSTNAATLRLRNLRHLTLHRTGITSFQLRHFISANPNLLTLGISRTRGVDPEFLNWLTAYLATGPGRIETLRLTHCDLLDLPSTDAHAYEFIKSLAQFSVVKQISLRGCRAVNEEIFMKACEDEAVIDSGIARIVSPKGVLIRQRREPDGSSLIPGWIVQERLRSVSPALTVTDPSNPYLGKLEVDPNLAL